MENKLVMPFINQSKDYSLGFECGIFWEMMINSRFIEKHLFNSENKEQIIKMCKRFHYDFEISEVQDGWMKLTAKLNPEKAN